MEHHFGLLRIRSKYQHNFDRLIQEKKNKILNDIESTTIGNVVSKNANFGIIIFVQNEEYGEKSLFTNHEIQFTC